MDAVRLASDAPIRAPRLETSVGHANAVASKGSGAHLVRMGHQTHALRRASLLGVVTGAIYGALARLAVASSPFGGAFAVMTLGFLVFVPIAMGFLTVRP